MILYETYIKLRIERYDVISFDIFDTLIHRRTKLPLNVFDNVEKKLKIDGIDENFKAKRISAENEAREVANGKEITIEDIYKNYNSSTIETSELIHMELEEEKANVYPDRKMIGIMEKAKSRNKRVILVSDMYLDESFIINLLDICGCTLYDKIYLSSSIGCRKQDGSLFQYVRDSESGKLIHIGDNYKSDYRMARKNGVDSLWLPLPYIRRLFFTLYGKLKEESNE